MSRPLNPRRAFIALILLAPIAAWYRWPGIGIYLAGAALIALVAYATIFRPPPRYRSHGWGQAQQAVDNELWHFGRSYTEDGVEPEFSPDVGRNSPCPCGSGKKYKRCCGRPRSTGKLK